MIIHQIVGYSNSGKTTIITKVIELLTNESLKVATVKHHGHDSPLVKEADKKDSVKHRDAGATSTLVASDDEFNWILQHEHPFTLDDYLRMFAVVSLDVILIEGYKKEVYPKTVVIRSNQEVNILNVATEIKAVICWDYSMIESLKGKYSFPLFHIDELTKYLLWFKRQIREGIL
ncbi:molybdopterin-guanine dinucleotide biosynthesis protein B [Salipaludibacillus sp. HK11]|uniref:molybdopterin-guanine dinucleotide biosynthesis protein B n=1 Tax=Salipaludibacillus sp. HK11 TaxID=3394320 RepID=UPI0039FCA055